MILIFFRFEYVNSTLIKDPQIFRFIKNGFESDYEENSQIYLVFENDLNGGYRRMTEAWKRANFIKNCRNLNLKHVLLLFEEMFRSNKIWQSKPWNKRKKSNKQLNCQLNFERHSSNKLNLENVKYWFWIAIYLQSVPIITSFYLINEKKRLI